MPKGRAPALARGPSVGETPSCSSDFLTYLVPKAYRQDRLGTWVLACLGVSHSALSRNAAQVLGCSFTPGVRVTFEQVTYMERAASVVGVWTPSFLLLFLRVCLGFGFCRYPVFPSGGWWHASSGLDVCLRPAVPGRSLCRVCLGLGFVVMPSFVARVRVVCFEEPVVP